MANEKYKYPLKSAVRFVNNIFLFDRILMFFFCKIATELKVINTH